MIKYSLFLFFIFISSSIYGQNYYRITADFTVKIKNTDGSLSLTRGKVFYDKNFKDLIYDISFPEHEKWVLRDTTLIKIKKDQKKDISSIPAINEFSVFHLALNVSLNNFGLDDSVYKMIRVEKKNNLVLSYWKVPGMKIENMDYIVLAKKGNQLVSVVIFNEHNKIINKQFFKDYAKIGAFKFPKRVIHISYNAENQESYQVFEFKNIQVNEVGNDKMYLFK